MFRDGSPGPLTLEHESTLNHSVWSQVPCQQPRHSPSICSMGLEESGVGLRNWGSSCREELSSLGFLWPSLSFTHRETPASRDVVLHQTSGRIHNKNVSTHLIGNIKQGKGRKELKEQGSAGRKETQDLPSFLPPFPT